LNFWRWTSPPLCNSSFIFSMFMQANEKLFYVNTSNSMKCHSGLSTRGKSCAQQRGPYYTQASRFCYQWPRPNEAFQPVVLKQGRWKHFSKLWMLSRSTCWLALIHIWTNRVIYMFIYSKCQSVLIVVENLNIIQDTETVLFFYSHFILFKATNTN